MMNTTLAVMTEEEVAAFGRRVDGSQSGFGALECSRGLLPLTAMQIDARVTGVIAAIDVAQTFVNTTGGPIEATYIFPLPDRLAVHKFRMEVAGRTIEGVIDERGAARQQYDEAIAAGHRAAITEEERAGVFTLRVGNLLAGERATIHLALVGPLPVDDGEVTFRFPLVVAPRYMPGAKLEGEQAGLGSELDTDAVPDASRISPPVRLPGMPNPVRLSIRVAIEDAGLRELASSLHAITTGAADARVVELQPGARLDRDFILRWRNDAETLRSSLVCTDDADGKGGTFMLTLVPPATTTVAAKPRDVVFVIDRSGSMEGWKMVAARRAVGRMIDSLTSRDRFSVLAFDNDVEAIPAPGLTEATDRNRFRAVEALGKIEARGGTEMAEPLVRALDSFAGSYADRERIVMFVTDGQVGNEDSLLHELAPRIRNARMFTLGVDQAVNAAFLRRLSAAGGGLCELVESEDRLDAVMEKVHRRIGTPIATELVLRASGLELESSSLAPSAAPGKLPDVYAGAPVVVLGRYLGRAPATATIELVGSSFGEPYTASVTRTAKSNELAPSWARARIRDLEDRYAAGARELEASIVETSKRFGVLSRFTAFLAIDRSEIANEKGRLHQVVQPVEPVAGTERANHARGGGGRAMVGAAISLPPRIVIAERSAPMGAPPPMTMQSPVRARFAMAPAPRSPAKREAAPTPPTPPPPPDASVYLASLADLAREVSALASAMAVKLLRQRIQQWIEDVLSVGGHDELASAVKAQLAKLTLETHSEIGSELAKLAVATTPRSGRAFWK